MSIVSKKAPSHILRTGDRFIARMKSGEIEYEFIGIAPYGNSYIILRLVENDQYIGVAYKWFNREVTKRIIRIRHRRRECNEVR